MTNEEFLEKISTSESVRSFARKRTKKYNYKNVALHERDEHENQGWEIDKENLNSIRLKKIKPHSSLFEDKVWSIFHKMGYDRLNIDNSFKIPYANNSNIPPRQIDVFCFDDDTALIIECKSSEIRKLRPLQTIINDFANIKSGITRYLNGFFETRKKIAHPTRAAITSNENDFLLFLTDWLINDE